MNKTVVIHQPDFLPYLGFFHRLLSADLFILLDHVQFVNGTSRSWTHRDKIKTPQGAQWLTLSVCKVPMSTSINAIELAEGGWKEKNLRLIQENYRRAPFFSEVYPYLEELYATPTNRLSQLTTASIKMLMELLDISVPIVFSSDLEPVGQKNQLLVDLLKKVNATRYLSGVGAKDYFTPEPFQQAQIDVVWQDFVHPVYPQQHGEFLPFLSSIDILLNCGIDHSRKILRGEY